MTGLIKLPRIPLKKEGVAVINNSRRGRDFIFSLFCFCFLFVGWLIEFQRGSGLGEIETLGGRDDRADNIGGFGPGLEPGCVSGGELETVEQSGGTFGFEMSGRKGVDYQREGELNGFRVLQRTEFEEAGYGTYSLTVAERAMALMESVMEVAPDSSGERWSLAAASVGLDVTAEWILHDLSPGSTPRGITCV